MVKLTDDLPRQIDEKTGGALPRHALPVSGFWFVRGLRLSCLTFAAPAAGACGLDWSAGKPLCAGSWATV